MRLDVPVVLPEGILDPEEVEGDALTSLLGSDSPTSLTAVTR